MAMFRGNDELVRHSIRCSSEEEAKRTAKALDMDRPVITENQDSSWTVEGYIPNDDTLDKIKATVPNNRRSYSMSELTGAIEVPMKGVCPISPLADESIGIDMMKTVLGSAISPSKTYVASQIRSEIDIAIDKTIREFADKMTEIQSKYETALKIITMQADKLKMLEAAGTYKGDILKSLEDITNRLTNIDGRLTNIESNYAHRNGPVISDLQSDCRTFRHDIYEMNKMIATNSENTVQIAGIVEEILSHIPTKPEDSVAKSDNIEEKTEI